MRPEEMGIPRSKPSRSSRTRVPAPGWKALAVLAVCGPVHAAAVDASTLEGKVLFGYQGWFSCPTGGSRDGWVHWSNGVPTPSSLTVDLYPDLSDFKTADLCPAGKMTIGGQQAYLFSSKTAVVVDAHFRWMEEYGLDGVLVQRFIGSAPGARSSGDAVLKNVMAAAATHGRTFAIEYDLSGGRESDYAQVIQDDWKYLVDNLKVTSHPCYLHHKGKPVVSIWGPGLNDGAHVPATGAGLQAFIAWFHSGPAQYQAFYMGGTPSGWATGDGDAYAGADWQAAYKAMDAVQPWTVGRYADTNAAKNWGRGRIAPDLAKTKANGNLYMPVIFPGFSWANLQKNNRPNQIPRLGGKFFWTQAYAAKSAGAAMLKIAMFDEVDEGTAMFKIASMRGQAPEQGYWLTLDADGADLPSDWYLRLAGEVTAMFHGSRPATAGMPEDPGAGMRLGKASFPVRSPHPTFTAMESGFAVAADGKASALILFTPAGKMIRRLALQGGQGFWNGRDGTGKRAAPGTYLARAEGTGTNAVTSRIFLP